jgi:hypothetical protein
MKSCQEIRNELQAHLIGLLERDEVADGAVSHFGQCDLDNDAWDAPTLWLEIWRGHHWSTPEGLLEVSEGDNETGKVYGYQLINVK